MRKYFLSLVAMATMILFSGCNKNEDFYISDNGDMVTFNIATPEMGTRAFSDGTTATNLIVAVYNSDTEEYLPRLTQELTINKTATVSLPLVTGVTYDVIFWAYADGSPYTLDKTYGVVEVDYTNGTPDTDDDFKANDEKLDAFYANRLGYTVTGPKVETVELTRPFAQLNVATLDYDLAAKSGIEITDTAIEVEGVYTSFNLRNPDGAVQGNSQTIVLGRNAKPNDTLTVADQSYTWLSMNYLLVNEKTTVRAKMETNKDVVTREWFNIPVQRNYRTNILGNILTTTTDFNVVIDEGFAEPDNTVSIWDGQSMQEPTINTSGSEPVYEVNSAANLAWLAAAVNGTLTKSTVAADSFEGKTFKLTADIDLNNEQWIPIGTKETQFKGIFDGGNHIIKNLNIVQTEAKEGKAYIGLFGYAEDVTIMNLTFENVNINIACLDIDHSQGHIGAVAGSLEGTSTIENVTVKGNIKVEATPDANGASRVAVIAGGNSYGDITMKDVHVIANEGSYLKANNNTGALAGQLQGKMVFENCSSNIDVTVNKFFAGGLVGIAAGDSQITNCHTTGDVAVIAGREGRHNDEYRVGGIAGGWADGKTKVCTLTNCSYTGNVSGENADGSVANPLDYRGYVGRGYTLANCAGSKVIIDEDEFVQAFDNVYGIYKVNGVYEIGNAATLTELAKIVNDGKYYFAGENIVLTNDIDLKNVEWTPIGSATKDHGFMGNFDGNGKIIRNLKMTTLPLDADGYAYAGLFGVTEGTEDNNNTIKNIVIENVTISTTGHIASAAIAYPYYTVVENIKVQGDINITGGDYTAGILAYTRRCVTASKLAIEANVGSSIIGKTTVGGVISDIQMNGGLTADYSNFKASGLTIKADKCVGGISGIIAQQTLDGAIVNDVTIVSEATTKGIVSGALGGTSTIKNISYKSVQGATAVVGGTYDSEDQFIVDGDIYVLIEK